MPQLDRLILKDYHLFKDLDWPISKYPLLVIRGENHDQVKSGSNLSGNAVGKTLLINTLLTLITATPPFIKRKNSAKELMNDKAVCKLIGSSEGKKFKIIQQSKKSKVGYDITVNGVKKKIKDIAVSRRMIEKLLPLNENQIYSTVYINSFRPSILQIGTPAQRYDFMESVFQLSVYDAINSQLLKMHSSMRSLHSSLPELKTKVATIKVTPATLKKLRLKSNALQESLKKKMSKLDKYNEINNRLSPIIPLLDSLKTTKGKKELKQLLQNLSKSIAKKKAWIAQENKQLGSNAAVAKIEVERKLLKAQQKKLLKYLRNFNEKSWPKIADDYRQQQARLTELQSLQQKREDVKEHLIEYWFSPHQIIVNAKDTVSLDGENTAQITTLIEEELAVVREQIGSSSKLLKDLTRLSQKSNCPTCKAIISKSTLDVMIANAKKTLALNEKNEEDLKSARKILRMKEKLDPRILDKDFSCVEDEIANIKENLLHYQSFLDSYNQYLECDSSLSRMKAVKSRPVDKKKLQQEIKQLAKLEQSYSYYDKELSVRSQLDKDYSKEEKTRLRDTYANTKQVIKTLTSSIMPLNERVSQITARLSTSNIAYKELQELSAKLTDIESQTQDYDIVIDLLEIYSPKGIRIAHIQSLIEAYINLMNQYSSYIFSEKVVFSAQLTKSKFPILAERQGKISDVNSLSGSETRQFLALSGLIIRMLLSKERRANLCVLDEVEAGMSKVNRELFIQHFIPLLMEFVPNVVLISPLNSSELSVSGANTLTLRRKNSVTTAHFS